MDMYGIVLWCWFVPILSQHWYGLVDSTTFHWHFTIHIRTASMYGIFPYVYHKKNQPNVGKYSHTWMVWDMLRIPTTVPSSFIDGNYWLITPHLPASLFWYSLASLATLRMSPKAPYGFDPAVATPRWPIGWMVDGGWFWGHQEGFPCFEGTTRHINTEDASQNLDEETWSNRSLLFHGVCV